MILGASKQAMDARRVTLVARVFILRGNVRRGCCEMVGVTIRCRHPRSCGQTGRKGLNRRREAVLEALHCDSQRDAFSGQGVWPCFSAHTGAKGRKWSLFAS